MWENKGKDLELAAEGLLKDPRVAQAKAMLLEAVKQHQQAITGIRPPNPNLKQSYDQLLASFTQQRGAKLWFPYLGSGLGNGALVELLDGSVKYDFICGIGVHFLGHSHPDIIASGIDAALSNTVMQGNLQQNADSIEISQLLLNASKLDHCFLSTSGVMANENAIKIAFQKKHPANRILAFERCFVGRTLAVSQITDKPGFREGLPLNYLIDYIPYFDPANPKESTERAISTLKKLISRYPKEHALMIFELVQGEGGFYSGTPEFFKALMDVLKENNIAIFDDEVQTFGRLPELFAFKYFGLESYVDIVSVGKLSQVCATLYTDEYNPRPGLLSQTFTGSTSAIRAGRVILQSLLTQGYHGADGKIAQINAHFTKNLAALENKYPQLIHGPFGIGCMISFTPYDGETQRTTQFVHALFEAGVISFFAGSNPTRVRFLVPAGAVTMHDIDEVTKIVEKTLVERK